MRNWLREILSTPFKEFPQFEAGLSLLPALPPEEAIDVLKMRLEFLKKDIEVIKNGLDATSKMKLPSLFTIESEYRLEGLKSEYAFVTKLVSRLRKDGCGFLKEWKKWHSENQK
jgi:hypothetical protein